MSGDIQARVVDEKELVIEGRVVKSEGTSSETSHSFRRSFSLPQYTDITSVMSLDGILTVTVIFKVRSTYMLLLIYRLLGVIFYEKKEKKIHYKYCFK